MSEVDWSKAPSWATKLMERTTDKGVYIWADSIEYRYTNNSRIHKFSDTTVVFKLVEMRPDKWQEGEERMDNIAQNGNDGHYEAGDIDISEAVKLQNEAHDKRVLDSIKNSPDYEIASTEKSITSDIIQHGNSNEYSCKIKTIVIDGIDHDIYVDVYDVLTAFNVINPAAAHAVKKQLKSGQRGVKGVIQDLTEARDSLNRAIEIERGK